MVSETPKDTPKASTPKRAAGMLVLRKEPPTTVAESIVAGPLKAPNGQDYYLTALGGLVRKTTGIASFLKPAKGDLAAAFGLNPKDAEKERAQFLGWDAKQLPTAGQQRFLHEKFFGLYKHEVILYLGLTPKGEVFAFVPQQEVSGANVKVLEGEKAIVDMMRFGRWFGDIHSHPWPGVPSPSGTDDRDMCSCPGIHGIISSLGYISWFASTKGYYAAAVGVDTTTAEVQEIQLHTLEDKPFAELLKEPRHEWQRAWGRGWMWDDKDSLFEQDDKNDPWGLVLGAECCVNQRLRNLRLEALLADWCTPRRDDNVWFGRKKNLVEGQIVSFLPGGQVQVKVLGEAHSRVMYGRRLAIDWASREDWSLLRRLRVARGEEGVEYRLRSPNGRVDILAAVPQGGTAAEVKSGEGQGTDDARQRLAFLRECTVLNNGFVTVETFTGPGGTKFLRVCKDQWGTPAKDIPAGVIRTRCITWSL